MSAPANGLRAQDWQVLSLPTHGDAARLVIAWHYSRTTANTSTYRHGLYPVAGAWGDPHGVALWIPPTRAAAESVAGEDWGGVLCLHRLAIEPGMPTNAASFLLGRSMRLIDRERWPVLLTYADTALGHTGAIYKATNWECLGETAAGDTWIDEHGRQRGRKRGGSTLLAEEMEAQGFTRRAAAPKVKFVHRARVRARTPLPH